MRAAYKFSSLAVSLLLITISGLPLETGWLVVSSANGTTGPLPEVVGFSENMLLSTDDSVYPHHVEVSMAISDNGTIFAGWKNAYTHNGIGVRVSVSKSVDEGATWTEPYDMPMFTSGVTGQSDPWMAWYGNSIYYAYLEYSIEGPDLSQITVARSDDYGVSWTPVTASHGGFFADKETMAISNDGTVYVIYSDTDDPTGLGECTLRLTRSTDGGSTFQEISEITESSRWHHGPYITLSNQGHVCIVWLWIEPESMEWGNLYLSRSLDQGETFEEWRLVNDDGNYSTAAPGKFTIPVIRLDNNDRVYVLWADGFEYGPHSFDVYLRYSDDYGETWSDRFRVNPTTEGNQWNPEMAIDSSGRLHIAYYDEQQEQYRPYYRTVNFTGVERNTPVFGDPIAIADTTTSSSFTRPGEYFSIQLDQDGIPHVAWSDGRNDEMDIYYAHGLAAESTELFPAEVVIALVGVFLLAVIVVLAYAKKR
ncbi:MAG: exo-alpha-sialidase [Candidatus Thorarchaeota archaeon]|nr:MAG: exo-alpha-sialidase [Candidatus Thorarchaeota archaeon]